MHVIKVKAGKTRYEVVVGSGMLEEAGKRIKKVIRGRKLLLVSDDSVHSLYADRVRRSLEGKGFTVAEYVFPHGEQSKNIRTYGEILESAARAGLDRQDGMVSLGGGVTGDLTGFAAASYMRGINYVQIPTTLLAAVDASVGGKTGFDLPEGKNLVGAFHQPRLVLCDPATILSLPYDTLHSGAAEVVKYGILERPDLIDRMKNVLKCVGKEQVDNCRYVPQSNQQVVDNSVENAEINGLEIISNLELIITNCVEIKARFVESDEHDNGCRAYLNLGHTFGHAIEKCSGYEVPHGEAVATGMALAADVAAGMGICTEGCRDSIRRLLGELGYATDTSIQREQLIEAIGSDKKRSGDTVRMILPVRIGECTDREVVWREL